MFGIKKFVLQILLMVLGTIIVLSAIVLAGCATPNDVIEGSGSIEKTVVDDGKSQFALAAKSETDNSQTDNSQTDNSQEDNSITMEVAEQPAAQPFKEAAFPLPKLPELPAVIIEKVDPEVVASTTAKVIDSKIKEREALILAETKATKDELLASIADVRQSQADEMTKMVEARASERERIILAEARAEELKIRAEQEQWRIWAFAGGGGLILVIIGILVSVWMYMRQSPLDQTRKVVNGRD